MMLDLTGKIPDDAIVVRPSAYSTWQSCPLAVQHSKDPRYDDRPSAQASFGTLVHAICEMYVNGESFPEDVTSMIALWREVAADSDEGFDILESGASKTDLRKWAAEALMAFELWYEKYWQPVGSKRTLVGAELSMAMPLGEAHDGRPIWLRGTADLVFDTQVDDLKTSSTGWPDNRAEIQGQHLAYTALARHHVLAEPEQAAYVIYNRKEQEWTWDDTTLPVNEAKERRVLTELLKMGQTLAIGAAAGKPVKTGAIWGRDGRGWWCSPKWCGAWNFCDAKYLLDDGKADEVRDGLITWKL